MGSITNNMRNLFNTIKKEFKENYDFLKDYHESNLIFIKEFLQDAKEHVIVNGNKITSAIDEELKRRKKITEDFVNNLKSKYLNQYIRVELKDGLGSYKIAKINDIKSNNKYCNLYYSISIVNTDGVYSIYEFDKGNSIILYSELEEEKIKIITEEEYKKEFNNAIEYYKTLVK